MIEEIVRAARNACVFVWNYSRTLWIICYACCAIGTAPFLRSHNARVKSANAVIVWFGSIFGMLALFGATWGAWNAVMTRLELPEPQNRPTWRRRLLRKSVMRILNIVGPVMAALLARKHRNDMEVLDIACYMWGLLTCLIQAVTEIGGGGAIGNVAGVVIVVFVTTKDVVSKTLLLVVVQEICGAAGDICGYIGKTTREVAANGGGAVAAR